MKLRLPAPPRRPHPPPPNTPCRAPAPARAFVPWLRPCLARGHPTPGVRAGGDAKSKERKPRPGRPAHNRCERAARAAWWGARPGSPTPLPLFLRPGDPPPPPPPPPPRRAPHPGLDRDRDQAAGSRALFRDPHPLLVSPRWPRRRPGLCPPHPPLERRRPRQASSAPAGPPRLFPWRRGRGRRGGRRLRRERRSGPRPRPVLRENRAPPRGAGETTGPKEP